MDHQIEKERESHTAESTSFWRLQFALMLLTFLFSAKHCKNWWSEWVRENLNHHALFHYTLYQILMLFIFWYLWSEWETCYSFFLFLFLSLPFLSFSSTKSNHFVVCKVVPLSSSIPSFLFLFLLSPIFLHLSLPPAHAFPLSHINVMLSIMCFSIPLLTPHCFYFRKH